MPIIGGGGEGLRFKDDQTRMLSQLEGMYALSTFPGTGIEINPSPLSADVQKEIREWLTSRERENYEEFKANLFTSAIDLGVSGKMTSFELEKEVIYRIAEGIFEPAFMSALSYAESKYKLAAVGGGGYGPFQLEPVAYEQAKKWSDTPMSHTVAATDPIWATEAASNTMKWLLESFDTLTASLVAWNRGFGNARTWVEGGSKVEDLPDATKILMTNFMLGLEKELAGDWNKLSESSLEQVRELANIVNSIIEEYPDVVKKSFPKETPYTFNVENQLEEVKERLDEILKVETETEARSIVETLLESIQTEIASLHATVTLIHSRLGTIRDTLWKAGYSSGGYTGNAPENVIAGVVHGGEWVAPAWMVEAYPVLFGKLENMRQGNTSKVASNVRGYQAGGMVDVVSMNAMFGTTLDTIASLLDAFAPLTDVISAGFNKILDVLLVVVGDNETAKNLIVNLKGLNAEMATTFENSGKTLRDLKEQMESMKTSLEDIEDNTSPASQKKTYEFPDLAGEFGRKLWQNLNAAEMKSLTGRLGPIGQWALPDWEAQYRESLINQLAGALEIAFSSLQGELTAGAAALLGGGAEAGAAFSMTQGIEALGALGVEGAAAAGAIGLVVIGASLLFKAFDNLVDVTGSLNRGFERGISKTVERLQRPLELIGEIVGTAIAPILQILTPLLDGFARAVAWFYNEIYVPIANWFGAGLKKIDIEGKLNYDDDETLATKSYSAGVTGSVTNNITVEIDTYGLVDPEGIKKLYELLGEYVDDLELVR